MARSIIKDVNKPSDKVKIIKQDQGVFEFTCQRCGAHSFNLVQASQHKFGGHGIGADRLRVCRNCNYADLITDKM